MNDKDIENDLLYYIQPLIGEYICKIEQAEADDITYLKLILSSLMRLLKQSLKKLNNGGVVEEVQLKYSQYSCFINYLKETLDHHRSRLSELRDSGDYRTKTVTLTIPQVCSFIKVASNLAKDDYKIFYYMLENSYPAIVTDLCRLFRYLVLPTIEAKTLEKYSLNETEEEQYSEVIEGVTYLITQFHNYVSNSFTYQEGSAHQNPYASFAMSLLEPMIYSTSDFIKKTTASKLKKFVTINCINQAKQRKKEKTEGAENIDLTPDTLSILKKKLFCTKVSLEQSKKDEFLLTPATDGKLI
jgi:hypothetical protein